MHVSFRQIRKEAFPVFREWNGWKNWKFLSGSAEGSIRRMGQLDEVVFENWTLLQEVAVFDEFDNYEDEVYLRCTRNTFLHFEGLV